MSKIFDDIWTTEQKSDAMALRGPIVVIGASGFIGAKLFFSLIQLRSDVYAASRSVNNSWRMLQFPDQVKSENLLNLDITDISDVRRQFQRLKPRTVINLSAYGAYERQRDPAQIHTVNYLGVLNLIQVLQDEGCDAFIQAGSSSEYGLNCVGPKETDQLLPNSDYSVSKGAASLLISYYGKIKNFPCVNLRLYSIFGPFEERDRLIPKLISQGLSGKLPPFAQPEISRDFVYVDDCTHAIVRSALTVCKLNPGISVNIGSGKKTTLREVAEISQKTFDIHEEPKFGTMANRKWDLSNWYGDVTLASKEMDWRAATSFQKGLELTKNWEIEAADRLCYTIAPKISKKISAIIACYRDHQAIPIMHQRLTKVFTELGVDYEIIFVNDNSPTEDELVIKQICQNDHHTIGISHARNFGSQSAFLSGMDISTGDAVVLLDGDLQDPPEIISEMYKKWIEGFDVVYGIRVKREAALYMQILYKIFYRIFRALSDINIPVDAGDFSLIDRKVYKKILSLPEKDVFLRGLRAWVGFRQTGVQYVRPERMFGTTTNSFVKNIWWAKKAIFSFSFKPLSYIQFIGISLFCISMLLLVGYVGMYFWGNQPAPRGITTIIVLLLGLGGVQLFSVSVIGDYLGKVLEEVKSRPRYIRTRIFSGREICNTEEQINKFIDSRSNIEK